MIIIIIFTFYNTKINLTVCIFKVSSSSCAASRTSSRTTLKQPPGAINLERSYQICQAVIQNSPNRNQLKCQLKPPPSVLIGKNTMYEKYNFKSC